MHPRLPLPLLVAVFIASVSMPQSYAAIVHSTTPDSLYLAEGGRHEWVGFMEGADSSGVTKFQQSGVLVHPNFVITTIHGLLENDSDRSSLLSNLRFGFGSNYVNDRQQVQNVAEVFLHPGYVDLGNGNDLALLRFDNPFQNIAPVERFRGDISNLAESDVYHAGYGLTGNFGSPLIEDGNKRGGVGARLTQGNIRVIGDFLTSRFEPDPNRFSFRDLGIGNALGDSGGFFGTKNNGAYELLAVNSIVLTGGLGITNIGSTLDNVWIDNTIATSVPEPSSLLLLVTFALFVLSSRRKHFRGRSAKLECVDGNGIKSLA